jgi:hypothetical protein
MGPMITFKQFILENGQAKKATGSDGTQVWYYNGKVHRTDGPAYIRPDGTEEWYINNKRHRLDGPAVENKNGKKEWYVNNKRHRLDGPAYIWSDGSKAWYVDNKEMTEDEFLVYTKQQEVKKHISKNDQSGWDL